MINSLLQYRKLASLAVVSLVMFGLTGCDDDQGPEEEEVIGQIRLVVGGVTINSVNMQPPAAAIVIPRGTHNVTVTAMTAAGQAITLTPTDFELRIASTNNAVISFTRTSSLAGTMNAATAGQASLALELFHLGEGHVDYAVTLAVTVQ